jgi:hypothetical protein
MLRTPKADQPKGLATLKMNLQPRFLPDLLEDTK